jgi:hypothetical protein
MSQRLTEKDCGFKRLCIFMQRLALLIICSFSMHTLAASGVPTRIIIPMASSTDINHEDYFFTQALRLALDSTLNDYGPYYLQEHQDFLVDHRLRRELSRGTLDVIWSPEHQTYGCKIRPVRESLLKELNDYRIFLIRGDDQERFSAISGIDDLRKLLGGMGAQWPDTQVLRANDLPTAVAPGYGKLFRMLAEDRFDYFARGLFQVSTEVDFYPDLNLKIEEELMLHYRNPYFFFVSYENEALAQRIEVGLQRARDNGSFDHLFNSIPRHQWAQQLLVESKRRVIELQHVEQELAQGVCSKPLLSDRR